MWPPYLLGEMQKKEPRFWGSEFGSGRVLAAILGRGFMMAMFFLSALTFLIPEAEAGRFLPRGADQALLLERIYTAKSGEMHLVRKEGEKGHALLRLRSGELIPLLAANGGGGACASWLSEQRGELPSGCEFVFKSEDSHLNWEVKSEEMKEGTVFQALRSSLRGRGDVAL
jgi:hypothetical protein